MHCSHQMPFGASLSREGGVLFRLWAPTAQSIELVFYALPGAEPELLPAQSEAGGWWECRVPEAVAGSLYQWEVDGELRVPDPASRQNPLGVHEPSCVVDPLQFQWDESWSGRPWNEVVLYELHIGSFTEEGSFSAACDRLPELAELGITAIELMPLASFPGRFGWGYDGVLPFAPHAAYGTPNELKHFVQEAHRLGLMVFLDVVYNHFGPDGNYLHAYAEDFFSPDRQSPWGAALAFDGANSATVRDFFVHNALYWIEEYRLDGLRLDAVHAIDDTRTPDFLDELSRAVRAATPRRHVHLVLEDENSRHARLRPQSEPGRYDGQWNDDFHHALHAALTGETGGYYHDYGNAPLDLLARSLAQGLLFEGSPRRPGGAREQVVAAAPQALGCMVNFTQNHDQVGNRPFGERLSQLVPPEAAALATLLALLTPATPLLFFGEEFGATTPFLYFADWQGELGDAVRAGRQREFGHQAPGRALPDPCSEDSFEASRLPELQAAGPAARERRDLVRRALAVRKSRIAPRQAALLHGQHEGHRVGGSGIEVRWRYAEGPDLVLMCNLGPEPLAGPAPLQGTELFEHRWPATTAARTWPAWSARWVLLEP